jgi:hypothetical protein
MLRVSRYVEEFDLETAEGSVRVPSQHVRFSIWANDHAKAVLSIPDDEAAALASFLVGHVRDEHDDADAKTPAPAAQGR